MSPRDSNVLVQSFYQLAVNASGIATLQGIQNAALGFMLSGDASSISSITLNGKTEQFQIAASPVDLFNATTTAIKWYQDGGPITIEVPDFRFLSP